MLQGVCQPVRRVGTRGQVWSEGWGRGGRCGQKGEDEGAGVVRRVGMRGQVWSEGWGRGGRYDQT